MEEVVTRVSKSDTEAERLIESEDTRLDWDRRRREFLKVDIVNELIQFLNFAEEEIINIYSKATSLEELAESLEHATKGNEPNIGANTAISHWKKHPEIVKDINRARALLKKKPIGFLNGKPTNESVLTKKSSGRQKKRR
ncbi:MAG: hypothetical protein PHU23_16115 [Dehalococcoidales bacterium]|nr:hypothetical protein [Dehalococcoidales bacterium]